MRIGIDVRLWNETGVGRYSRNLVRYLVLQDTKNEYVLFAKSDTSKEIKKEIPRHWKIVTTDIRWHSLQEQLFFPSILNKEQLDVVHFTYFSVPIFYSKPFVVTIHDLILHHFPTGEASTLLTPLYYTKWLGYRFIIDQTIKKAKKIITVSQATKKEITDHFSINSQLIHVTYEGVDEKISNLKSNRDLRYQISNKPEINALINQKYFLYVGNAYPHKNIEFLIEAYQQIAGTATKLVFVGKEDYFYKKLKKSIQQKELTKSIIFLDQVSDQELSWLYQHTLALVAPSKMEGFGLPLIEAMAHDCLVVASDIPVFKEICQDAALYFSLDNAKSLSTIMQEIIQKPQSFFAQYTKKGKEQAKIFSWEKMAKETLSIYESIRK